MKNSNLPIRKSYKLVAVMLFIIAFLITGAVAQDTKEVYLGKQIAALTKQIAAAPKNDKLYVERAKVYQELEKFTEARADAEKALQINPKNAEAMKLRAALKTRNNSQKIVKDSDEREDQNSSSADKKTAIDPKTSEGLVERGTLNLKNKKLAEALTDAENALKIRASNSYALMLRSDVKAAKGDKAGADADFRQAVKMRGESSLVGRIVSHSGKTLTGIVVKGKAIGEASGYATIADVKKDVFIGVYSKVLIQNVKTKRIMIYEAIFAEDSERNMIRAETESQPAIQKEPSILAGYKYMKIAGDQSLLLPKTDRAAAALDYNVIDILDTSNLSLARRENLPLAAGSKSLDNLMDSEIATSHFDEAKEIYLYLEKISAKAADQNEVKATRKTNLKKLYKASVELHKFVEQEMEKYKYTDEEKRSVRYQPIYV